PMQGPFRADTVFRTWLVTPATPPPTEGTTVEGAGGKKASWSPAAPDDEGFVTGPARTWGYAQVTVGRRTVRLAEVTGAAVLFVNGTPIQGDVYGHGIVRSPVRLVAGRNDLFVTGIRGRFRVRFLEPPADVFVAAEDPTLPDLIPGRKVTPSAAVLVVNASGRPIQPLHVEGLVRAGEQVVSAGISLPFLPAVSELKIPLVFPAFDVPSDATAGSLEVTVSTCDGPARTRRFDLEVRKPGEPYRRTFVSEIDGSVQSYGVRPPQGPLPEGGRMRLVLTLHGASVDALGQVRAYAPKPDFWIIAPTNRRPYGFDWQDWGRLDAYEVLADALTFTGVDRRDVHLTGHSMGGHGAWHLAANDPDGFASVAPSAAWISFATYTNRTPNGPLSALWKAADRASDTAALRLNLAQLPIRQLHGTADDNVPVAEAQAMEKLLKDIDPRYAVDYVEGAGHWWDRDKKRPGIDCVDWPAFFELFRQNRIPRWPDRLDFVSVDPSIDAQHYWIRVDQPLRYGEPMRVQARHVASANRVRVRTKNVRHLEIALPKRWAIKTVLVDDLEIPWSGADEILGLDRSATSWHLATASIPSAWKSAKRSGPFKRVFDRRFVLVYGTAGKGEEGRALYERARFDAQRWRYVANGFAEFVPDRIFIADPSRYANRNIVLYGNADSNAAWAKAVPTHCPIQLGRGRVQVGRQRFTANDLGAFVVYPRRGEAKTLVGAVGDTGLVGQRITILSRYFSSGVGYPDYVIFGPDVLSRGDAGVKVAGFFDARWDLVKPRPAPAPPPKR
ncbi:MAG: alpha/beta hydrolase-fold protein, partial [Planctomycetota bacterium]